jgi:hypothetical protein
MNELTVLALEIQRFCEERGWKSCIIGGLAVQHWGEPRFTRDVDMTLFTGFGDEGAYVDPWLEAYEARIPNARSFALANRVLLLRSNNGIGIDIALGGLPFEEGAMGRAPRVEMEAGAFLKLCSPEDLVVMKAFANRLIDWHDIRGILVRQGAEKLDWDYIKTQLEPLCEIKGEPESVARLQALREECGG